MVKNKIKTNKNENFDKKLAMLKDSKIEIPNRLDMENHKISNRQQEFRDTKKYGNIKPFDFNMTVKII